jgi:hypothetical protein
MRRLQVRRAYGAVALIPAFCLGVPAISSARDVDVTYTVRQAGLLPVTDRGPNAAPDYLVASSPLYNRRNTRRVGLASIACTFPPESRTPRCVSTLFLRRGSINLEGDLEQPKFTFRVTGGRGIYRNATGSARGTALTPREPDPLKGLVRLRLRLRDVE